MAHVCQVVELIEFLLVLHELLVLHLNKVQNVGVEFEVGCVTCCEHDTGHEKLEVFQRNGIAPTHSAHI